MERVSPNDVGLSESRLSRINAAMRRYVDEEKLAGTVTLVARRGGIAHFEAIGQRDIEANKPMELDTIFRIYSMTKPIVSVALMMLYEEGYFQLKDPVAKFIPAFENLKVLEKPGFARQNLVEPQQAMTIAHLLSHTSGLTYGFFENSPVEAMYKEMEVLDRDSTLAEMVQKLAKIPLLHHPGTVWNYSVSTDVVGYLVEVISGMRLDQFLNERIFGPLGMQETGFYVPEADTNRFSNTYGPAEDGGLKIIDSASDSPYLRPPNRLSGGGGLVSTASDYIRFAQMLLNNGQLNDTRLLSRKTIELMTSNHLPNSLMPFRLGDSVAAGYGFGLGFRVLSDVAASNVLGSKGEYGWSGAANTYFWVDPQEEMIGILMTQFMPSGTYPVSPDFRLLAYQSIID